MRKTFFLMMSFLFVLTGWTLGGTSGKITGRVTDAETGEPLPGVNVMIETMWFGDIEVDIMQKQGAVTNIDGYYTILNVSPEEFTLSFSMMGYAVKKVQHVKVNIDLTTTVNSEMMSEAIMGEEVVVVAERKVVQRDISNSQMNIESKTIKKLPVENVERVITLQAGIEQGSYGLEIRGGSADQTIFMVDGLSLNDERNNVAYSTISLSSVKEIKVQTGGFNAEYGNIRSGLVNVVTKDGDPARYNGTFSVQYSPPQDKHFGDSPYDANSYFNRPYTDPDVCWTGTSNGNWDLYTKTQNISFEGWNSIAAETLKDDDPSNDLTPEQAKRVWEWQRRREGEITDPDYVFDLGFGGPVPLISKKLGNLRFYVSHYQNKEMFIFPLSLDARKDRRTQLKLTTDLNKSMKLMVQGLYGEEESVCPYSWTTTPTGRLLRSQSEIADLLNSSSGASMLYMPSYYSPGKIYRTMIGTKFTHTLNPETFYEVSAQYKITENDTYGMDTRDTTSRYEIFDGYYLDEAPFGYWGYSTSGIDGTSLGGWANLGRDESETKTFSINGDLTTQWNQNNQFKAGLSFVMNDLNIKSYTDNPSMGTWNRQQFYHEKPYRVGAYVQDKLEFEGFVANVGLRMDLTDANSEVFDLDEYSKMYSAGYGNKLEAEAPTKDSEAKWAFSPRLGISHPISVNSKLYFNYGHFQAEPQSSYRFRLQRESNGLVTSIGNPDLEMEKTIAYELGYEHSVLNHYLVKIAAYYKDVSNQYSSIYYRNISGTVAYYRYENNSYADIRGLELTLYKRQGRWITGSVNYTYDVRSSGYFNIRSFYEDPNRQRDYLRDNPFYQSKPKARPFARANVDIHSPKKFGPQWNGFYPLEEISMTWIAEWKTGSYTTYNPHNEPGIKNNCQWKDRYNFDLRISKTINISRFDVQMFVDFSNLFNNKFLNYAGFSDSYDWNDYLESLCFDWEEGDQKGDDRIGEYRPWDVKYDPLEPNPNNDPEITKRNNKRKDKKSYIDNPNIRSMAFLNPRMIKFGVKINF